MQLPERPEEGRLLAGVCASLAHAWLMDVTLLRLAFLVASFAWGLGLLIYGLLWLLLPAEGCTPSERIRDIARHNLTNIRQELGRTRHTFAKGWQEAKRKPWPLPLDRRWLAIGLVAIGVLLFLGSIGAFGWLTGTRALGLSIVGVGAALLVALRH
ncbi:MAG: PspC domain-containing protein [Deltaproteobacteria bacterium]|nr:PspC domain-containing protein [Deltaproteobacteria bacterium]